MAVATNHSTNHSETTQLNATTSHIRDNVVTFESAGRYTYMRVGLSFVVLGGLGTKHPPFTQEYSTGMSR